MTVANNPATPARQTEHGSAEQLRTQFRDAMAHLGAAVNIVTTDGPGGRAGFSATAICSVTDDPPTLLVCLNRNASVHAAVASNATLCVNTLRPGHEELSQLFGGKNPQEVRFAGANWSTSATGAPVLNDALISFDCRIVDRLASGTHDILIGQVQSIRLGDIREGLIYFGRRYHHLSVA